MGLIRLFPGRFAPLILGLSLVALCGCLDKPVESLAIPDSGFTSKGPTGPELSPPGRGLAQDPPPALGPTSASKASLPPPPPDYSLEPGPQRPGPQETTFRGGAG
jgi:hypothetical protein